MGNKWSDIAKYLPGRTDNCIENNYYSKLRKFIRKIIKQINKENAHNDIDINKYKSEFIYKLLKKSKICYRNLNKEIILNIIKSNKKENKNIISKINNNSKYDKKLLI